MSSFESVTVSEAAALLREKAALLFDVRTPHEFFSHRVAEAQLIPLHTLSSRHIEIPRDPPSGMKLLIICEHGVRSVAACQLLAANGWNGVTNVTGGMADWIACGLPVEWQ